MQNMSIDELAEMPSYNLAETVHNKWKQASGDRGVDLYVATVDDYVRGFLQVINYHQFLKGDVGGTGPSKDELKLRVAERKAQRTGDPSVLKDFMLQMPGATDFCIRIANKVGEEVFGSRMRKPNMPIGADDESHRPDKVNFSRPRHSSGHLGTFTDPLPIIEEEDGVDEAGNDRNSDAVRKDDRSPTVATPTPSSATLVQRPVYFASLGCRRHMFSYQSGTSLGCQRILLKLVLHNAL
jgi:hypothetical protein